MVHLWVWDVLLLGGRFLLLTFVAGQGLTFTSLSAPVSLRMTQAVFILHCEIDNEEGINDHQAKEISQQHTAPAATQWPNGCRSFFLRLNSESLRVSELCSLREEKKRKTSKKSIHQSIHQLVDQTNKRNCKPHYFNSWPCVTAAAQLSCCGDGGGGGSEVPLSLQSSCIHRPSATSL